MESGSVQGRPSKGDGRVRKAGKPAAKAEAKEAGKVKELGAPQRIRLLASDIDIVFVSNLTENNDSAYGIYEEKSTTIKLLEGMSKSALQDTIVHEILHAILQAYELDSEKIVRALTPGVMSMIKDNPQLVLFLQS